MQTLNFVCDVGAERDLVLHLPPTVALGRHRIALVIDPPEPVAPQAAITPVPDSVPPRTSLWAELSALREQAAREGSLPAPLSWEEVLTEAARRRGEPRG